MSRFTAPLVVTPTDDYKRWRILHSTTLDGEYPSSAIDFGYDIGEEGSGLSIKPPECFETNFASIPWFARWLIPTWGRHTNPAIIHDYLYAGGIISTARSGIILPYRLNLPLPTRKQADRIMLEGMEVMGVRKWMRLAIYFGLRAGGWWAWRRIRKSK